jgi:hypothetical protein
MRVVIDRNVHAQVRGDLPELIEIHVAARLVSPSALWVKPGDARATSVGQDVLTAVDMIPGVEEVMAQRHSLSFVIAKAFDGNAVVAEVVRAIKSSTGERADHEA